MKKHFGFIVLLFLFTTSFSQEKRKTKGNPNLKILILNGYFDVGTVFCDVEFSFNHLGLDPELKKNLTMKYFETRHLVCLHEPPVQKFKQDVDEFINQTSN